MHKTGYQEFLKNQIGHTQFFLGYQRVTIEGLVEKVERKRLYWCGYKTEYKMEEQSSWFFKVIL